MEAETLREYIFNCLWVDWMILMNYLCFIFIVVASIRSSFSLVYNWREGHPEREAFRDVFFLKKCFYDFEILGFGCIFASLFLEK